MEFFEGLNFSSANEDGATEIAVLGPQRGRILSLAGSGARALDLLLGEADEVVALDTNPAQLALLLLKMAGFATLSHPELLAYLGVAPCADRLALHRRVAPALGPEARAFWQDRQALVARGVWYAGLWERILARAAATGRLLWGRAMDSVFAARDPGEQAEIWRTRIDGPLWRFALRGVCQPWLWTHVIGEPGGRQMPGARTASRRLAAAFSAASGRFLFRDSDAASLMLRGRHDPAGALPPHLTPEAHARIRARLDRIKPLRGALRDLPALDVGPIDGFSLSDFGSYCDLAIWAASWQGVRACAAPGAIFCERVFLNPLPLPGGIALAPAESRCLTLRDRSIVYDIRVGQVEGGLAGAGDGNRTRIISLEG
ncbi:DUF3419 family protein [Roseisalinus antarcticus]|uniref:DUF3419 family protein n=1 Tax=Roseisalinus antarcticus TaxID=254357 RepID=UPI000A268BCC